MRRIAALLLTLVVLAGCMSMLPAMCASATDNSDGTTVDMYARRNHASSVLFTVRDADTKLPLSRATVTLNAADGFRSYLTNSKGQCYVGVYYYETNGSTYYYTVNRAGYSGSYTDAIDKESVPDKFRETYALRTVELKKIQGAVEKNINIRNAIKPNEPVAGAVLQLKDPQGNITYNMADSNGKMLVSVMPGVSYTYTLSDQNGKFITDTGTLAPLKANAMPSVMYLYPQGVKTNAKLQFVVYAIVDKQRAPLPNATVTVTFADQRVKTFKTDANGESKLFSAYVGETLHFTGAFRDFTMAGPTQRVVEEQTTTIGVVMSGKGVVPPNPKTGDDGCVIHWYLMACLLIIALLMVWRIYARRMGGRVVELLLMGVSVAIGITGLCIQQCTIDIVISVLLLAIAASFGWIQKEQLLKK